jgi:NADPH-dependent 2,4-dienoyl-CoA reductase/sulfur reductase-like enzyme
MHSTTTLLCVRGIGAQQTPFDASSGVTIQPDGGIVCDETLCAAPNVYVGGDIANFPLWSLGGARVRIEHWVSGGDS